MEIIDELSRKVQLVSKEIVELKKDKQQLAAELELLKNQMRGSQQLVRENEKLKRDHDQIRSRLLRLQRKIDKHLLVETTLASQGIGGVSEEPV